MDKIVVFPIIITPVPHERKYPYLVEIPALDGMTEGCDIADAIEMARRLHSFR